MTKLTPFKRHGCQNLADQSANNTTSPIALNFDSAKVGLLSKHARVPLFRSDAWENRVFKRLCEPTATHSAARVILTRISNSIAGSS